MNPKEKEAADIAAVDKARAEFRLTKTDIRILARATWLAKNITRDENLAKSELVNLATQIEIADCISESSWVWHDIFGVGYVPDNLFAIADAIREVGGKK